MASFEKIPTEAEILSRLSRRELVFPPLSLDADAGVTVRADIILGARWENAVYRFAVEVKISATPKVIREAVRAAQSSDYGGVSPMLVVPYLSPASLATLEAEKVSGIDLCGNGIVVVPGRLLVYRTGAANRFRRGTRTGTAYRGKRSLVARCFLVEPRYSSVGAILDAIRARGGRLSLATVSKALARLEDDLVIGRRASEIRLLQADKILQRLVAAFSPPKIERRVVAKARIPLGELLARASDVAKDRKLRLSVTGASSGEQYSVMAREPIMSMYCSSLTGLLDRLGDSVEETDMFPNVELLETADETVYFDARLVGRVRWAPPVQAYLELMAGDKRDRETAEQVETGILGRLSDGE